jgi:hypothetical protein
MYYTVPIQGEELEFKLSDWNKIRQERRVLFQMPTLPANFEQDCTTYSDDKSPQLERFGHGDLTYESELQGSPRYTFGGFRSRRKSQQVMNHR